MHAATNPAFYFRSPRTLMVMDMAKGQQRGNREAKKPKKEKTQLIAAAPSRKAATLSFASAPKTGFRAHKGRG
jgi:hypothetical protein